MNQKAQKLKASLIRGNVLERKATWNDLEQFFGKEKEEIISDMKALFPESELNKIMIQLAQNEGEPA